MLVVDQIKKDDPQLRLLAVVVLAGLCVLLAGLWWVQLISTNYYRGKLQTQSIRTIRMPAVRGKILDREGRPLAENRPSYNVDLFLEELTPKFQFAYTNALSQIKTNISLQIAAKEKQLGRKLTPAEKKPFALTEAYKNQLKEQMRYQVVSNLVTDLSARMQEPIAISQPDFQTRYEIARALPLPILADGMTPAELARFEEQSASTPGVEMEVQSLRYYPNGPVGAHMLGYLAHEYRTNESGKTSKYNYWLTDFKGNTGLEGLYDDDLHGAPGEKAVLVNNLGYRQSENVEMPPEQGRNLVLTIDLDIQKAADIALNEQQAKVRGAVIVMDAQNGDVLAMASAPSYDPNHFIVRPDAATRQVEQERWDDETLGLQRNRTIYENYHPGSIFKIVVGMAALENGVLDPNELFHSDGYFTVGRSPKHRGDTAGEGYFDFNRAMALSSNPYFVHYGTNAGVLQKIVAIGHRLHLGERTGIIPHQEAAGRFPTEKEISSGWSLGDTANVSIGQGVLDVTTIQMAVMTAAVANGGRVFWPRLVSRIEEPDGSIVRTFPEGRIRDNLGVSARTLKIVHGGMLADVETEEGSGHGVGIPGWWRIAGKTGTAEVENRNGHVERSLKDTWFVSFAPEENPKYVVVATVEGGASGAKTCVPIVHKVYLALQKREQHGALAALK